MVLLHVDSANIDITKYNKNDFVININDIKFSKVKLIGAVIESPTNKLYYKIAVKELIKNIDGNTTGGYNFIIPNISTTTIYLNESNNIKNEADVQEKKNISQFTITITDESNNKYNFTKDYLLIFELI